MCGPLTVRLVLIYNIILKIQYFVKCFPWLLYLKKWVVDENCFKPFKTYVKLFWKPGS